MIFCQASGAKKANVGVTLARNLITTTSTTAHSPQNQTIRHITYSTYRASERDIRAGCTYGPFDTVEDMLAALNS
jgi:hypothetical protein